MTVVTTGFSPAVVARLLSLALPRRGQGGRVPAPAAVKRFAASKLLEKPQDWMLDVEGRVAAVAAVAALDDVARQEAADRWWSAIDQGALSSTTHKARRLAAIGALLFPDDDRFWSAVVGLPVDSWGWYAGLVCAAAPDHEALAPFVDVAPARQVWNAIDAAGLILRGGDAAVALLRPVFLAALKDFPPQSKRDWNVPDLDARLGEGFAIFAALGDVDVIRALVRQGEHSRALPGLQAAIAHAPSLLLQACLTEGIGRAGLARDLAIHLVRGGVVVDMALPSLPELEAAPVAPTTSLPASLQAPPWQGRKVVAAPRRPGLAPVTTPALADACILSASESAALRAPSTSVDEARWSLVGWGPKADAIAAAAPRWAAGDDTGLRGTLDDVDAHLRDGWRVVGSGTMPFIDDGLLLPLWRAFHPSAWDLDEARARHLVARLGVDAIDGMLVRAGLTATVPPPTHGVDGPMAARAIAKLAHSLGALAPVASVRIAPAVARGLLKKTTRRPALGWLKRHPHHAAAGLVPLALDDGPDAAGARDGLHLLVALGHVDLVREAARRHGEDVVAAIETLLSADPLALAKAPRRPAWLEVERLPPLRTTDGHVLDVDAMRIAVGIIAASTIDVPYAAFADLQATVTSSSLAVFVHALWRQWWLAGAPSTDAWVQAGLAHGADARVAMALSASLVVQAGDGLAARARVGLDVLEAMSDRDDDDDAPIIALQRFSRAVKGASLKAAASQAIDRLALARGLDADALADRLVPDLGLDDDGTMPLDLGAGRVVRLTFDALLRPRFRLTDGSVVEKLPPVGKAGDKVAHAAAKATVKAVTKEATDVGKTVLARLERLLRAGRVVEQGAARRCFFAHPLVVHIARRLVWLDVRRDDDGATVLGAFRVAEDGTFADAHDDVFALRGSHVGLLHPASADADVVVRFRAIFRDYELIQPFAQLDRPVLVPAADERGDVLRRYEGRVVDTSRLFTLEARGWQRTHGASVRRVGDGEATLTYAPGISGGPDAYRGPQTLGPVTFRGHGGFGGLDAVAVSELLYDLERLFPAT